MTRAELYSHHDKLMKIREQLKDAKNRVKVEKHDNDALALVVHYDRMIAQINYTLVRQYDCENDPSR